MVSNLPGGTWHNRHGHKKDSPCGPDCTAPAAARSSYSNVKWHVHLTKAPLQYVSPESNRKRTERQERKVMDGWDWIWCVNVMSMNMRSANGNAVDVAVEKKKKKKVRKYRVYLLCNISSLWLYLCNFVFCIFMFTRRPNWGAAPGRLQFELRGRPRQATHCKFMPNLRHSHTWIFSIARTACSGISVGENRCVVFYRFVVYFISYCMYVSY